MNKMILCFIFLVCNNLNVFAQFEMPRLGPIAITDSLLGEITALRSAFDVKFYDIKIQTNFQSKSIAGSVRIDFLTKNRVDTLPIDLAYAFRIDSIIFHNRKVSFDRFDRRVNILGLGLVQGLNDSVKIYYQGSPQIAKNPPWDGGFIWRKDNNKKQWISVACQGDGASIWWPCKDHPSDKPDSVRVEIIAPKGLTAISNGVLVKTYFPTDTTQSFIWKTQYPINLYNVALYIGDYELIKDSYRTFSNDTLGIEYWVLKYHVYQAKFHFYQTNSILHAFEQYFGQYPFIKDGYALVEAPFLGMEHQGAIAYGNNFLNGYLGGRIPDDIKFDFIILHESGHEWWGNAVSSDDNSDVWIHESFTTYMEALYVEWKYNYQKSIEYLQLQRTYIKNLSPLIGPRDVNFHDFKDSDVYFKGSWMLHSLRNTINNDTLWFKVLKQTFQHFSGSVINTKLLVEYINLQLGQDYTPYFQQWLMHSEQPTLEYFIKKSHKSQTIYYRWATKEAGFNMQMKLNVKDKVWRIKPTTKWQKTNFSDFNDLEITLDHDSFLFEEKRLLSKPKF